MVEEFRSYIDEQKLFHPDDKVLLAVSGGVDSMVMTYLFHRCGYRFAIAHCNFQLRGKESDQDEEFVRKMAGEYQVKCYTHRFETQAYADENGVSLQMAARELRYSWFEQLLADFEFKYLATAHHLNDSLETALFNLTKGTGLSGLKGIAVKKQYRIRPLLFADKKDIKSFATQQGIPWREDHSNTSVKYHRNLIRHEVIPLLEKINPGLVGSFLQSSRKITAAENIVSANLQALREKLIETDEPDIYINKKALAAQPEGTFVLFEILRPYGFNYSQASDIYTKLGAAGKRYLSDRYQLNVDRTQLIISPLSVKPVSPVTIELSQQKIPTPEFDLSLEQMPAKDFTITGDKNTAALDFDKLGFPLKVRPWRSGDWFIPLGMGHKKKLSDFMIDEKIPLNLKARVFVLESAEDIVWVIGHRIDDRYKISKYSRRVLVVKKQAHA